MVRAAPRSAACAKLSPAGRGSCLRRAPRPQLGDGAEWSQQRGVLGERGRQGDVVVRGAWAKDGLGKLTVAGVAAHGVLNVAAAATGLWVGRRGHRSINRRGGVPP